MALHSGLYGWEADRETCGSFFPANEARLVFEWRLRNDECNLCGKARCLAELASHAKGGKELGRLAWLHTPQSKLGSKRLREYAQLREK